MTTLARITPKCKKCKKGTLKPILGSWWQLVGNTSTEAHDHYQCNNCRQKFVIIKLENKKGLLFKLDFKLLNERDEAKGAGLIFGEIKKKRGLSYCN